MTCKKPTIDTCLNCSETECKYDDTRDRDRKNRIKNFLDQKGKAIKTTTNKKAYIHYAGPGKEMVTIELDPNDLEKALEIINRGKGLMAFFEDCMHLNDPHQKAIMGLIDQLRIAEQEAGER